MTASKKISDTEVKHLKCKIKKVGGPLTEKHDGVNLYIGDHYKMAKKEPTPTTKNCFYLQAKMQLPSLSNAIFICIINQGL